ncbi:hypothetical protein [Sphingopyxis sp. GW247-27LB]|uniref:hypothetical protein n=1 Tax=Sphingopyxis sp. GW247-27LB TaxID=2012632 RepID=UPI000BA727A2|nr:hypothetical protein [Sphingopyxis sp. GW247-27LB]PAL20199.1 hypothetical protein CD928_17475 [Sphingopyxis sp. GW247-27LB]
MSTPCPARAAALRRHREIFEYAREHGLTLREAEAELVRESARRARERLAVIQRCGRAAVAPGAPIGAEPPQGPAPENAPWMMRD